MFPSLTGLSGTWITALEKAIKTAIDMISSYLSIDSLPRRPNHSLAAVSFQVSRPLRFLFDTFFDEKLILAAILGDLGAILGGLGAVVGRSWAVLGGLGAVLGRSWGLLR